MKRDVTLTAAAMLAGLLLGTAGEAGEPGPHGWREHRGHARLHHGRVHHPHAMHRGHRHGPHAVHGMPADGSRSRHHPDFFAGTGAEADDAAILGAGRLQVVEYREPYLPAGVIYNVPSSLHGHHASAIRVRY